MRTKKLLAVLAGLMVLGFVVSAGANLLSAPTPNKTDLRGVTQNWDKTLPANDTGDPCNSSRFTCVMGGEAVRDNETGLVWDRSQDGTRTIWASAINHCIMRKVGDRKGWHLPTIEQLASLVDSSNFNPALPTGHPFQEVRSSNYWSATTNTGFTTEAPTQAWQVFFVEGAMDIRNKASSGQVWCVRGGQSFDGNTHSTLH